MSREIMLNVSGLDVRVTRRWYRSLRDDDGSIWCETSNAEECVEQSKEHACHFQVLETIEITQPWRAWVPDAPR